MLAGTFCWNGRVKAELTVSSFQESQGQELLVSYLALRKPETGGEGEGFRSSDLVSRH